MTDTTTDPIHDFIAKTLETNDVVLFMKGTPDAPQCGFSAVTVQISVDSIDQLEALSAVSERDLPPGLGAQIEMARFGAGAKPPQTRRA